MNVCIYTRVSTAEQKEKGYSLGEQETRLRAYCDAKGWTCVKIYSDGGYTGSNTNRPALKQMMSDIEIYDAVLVWKLDRLSRSQKDTLILIDELQKNDCAFISLVESFDTSTSIGRAMLGILSTFAQLEREQISERMKMGKVGRAKSGKWHGGGHAPTGYTYDKESGRLVPNDEADQVRLIFQMFLEGTGYVEITKHMHSHYTTRYTSYNNACTTRRILMNPVYTGAVTHNGEVIPGCHEAIIDQDTFARVQAVLRSRKNGNKNAAGRHLLTGMVRCECGSAMALNQVHQYKYYACSRRNSFNLKQRGKKCDNRRIREDELNDTVKQSILSLNFKEVKREKPKKADNKKEIEKIDRQIGRLIELFQVDGIPVETLKQKIADLEKKKDSLTNVPAPVDIKPYVKMKSKAEQMFEDGKGRAVVDALVDKVVVTRSGIEIHWSFAS